MPRTRKGYSDEAYLRKATAFLGECRSEDPLGGLWDAADLQWWWREDLYRDPANQLFWEDTSGRTLGFMLVSPRYRCVDYEILPSLGETGVAQEIFACALATLGAMCDKATGGDEPCTLFVRHDRPEFRNMAEQAGFVRTDRALVQTRLRLDCGIPTVPLADGHHLRSVGADDFVDGKPPVLRISAGMYRRISQTPLYRQDRHLVVVAPDSDIAAECICWVDQENGIGVFEPIRTLEAYQRRGLARAMMAKRLHRMADLGVTLAKVSHYASNHAAAALYRWLGFEMAFERIVYEYRSGARGGPGNRSCGVNDGHVYRRG